MHALQLIFGSVVHFLRWLVKMLTVLTRYVIVLIRIRMVTACMTVNCMAQFSTHACSIHQSSTLLTRSSCSSQGSVQLGDIHYGCSLCSCMAGPADEYTEGLLQCDFAACWRPRIQTECCVVITSYYWYLHAY